MPKNTRTRSPLWYPTAAFVLLVTLSFGWYAVTLIRIQTGSPTIERDYVGEFIDELSAVEQHRTAQPILDFLAAASSLAAQPSMPSDSDRGLEREALALSALEFPSGSEERRLAESLAARLSQGPIFAPYEGDWDPYFGDSRSDPTWDVVRDGMNSAPEFAQLIRIAAARPHLGPLFLESERGTPLVLTMMPYASPLRSAARIALTEAEVAIEAQDTERLVEAWTSSLGLIRLCGEQRSLIGALVRAALQAILWDQISGVLIENPDLIPAPVLQRLLRDIQDQSYADVYAFERLMFDDAAQRTWSKSGLFLSRGWFDEDINGAASAPSALDILLSPLAHLAAGDRATNQAEADAYYDTLIDLLRMNVWEITAADLPRPPKGPILRELVLGPETILSVSVQDRIRARTVRAAIACELYRRAEGAYPETIDQLAPTYLDRVPLDPFTGDPMRYARVGPSFTIYSVGNDRQDNGGEHDRSSARWTLLPTNSLANYDYAVFPPED